jgi:DNA ligase D-like protein (predicted polymerase)
VLCDDRRTLLWLANQRAVEFHVPFRRADDDAPTGLVLDLDPPEGAPFEQVVRTAGLVRRALADSGLDGAVKTSGAKGLHVVVPIRGASVEDTAAATRALAARTERLDPELATTAYIREDRGGRVFVDSTRSGQGTIVAAYSPRVRPRLPVSVPVAWEDLDGVRPGDVTVTDAAARLGGGDPWAALMPEPQELPAELVTEGHTIPVARVRAMHEGKRRARAKRDEAEG